MYVCIYMTQRRLYEHAPAQTCLCFYGVSFPRAKGILGFLDPGLSSVWILTAWIGRGKDSSCTAFTIISTAYVSDNHKTSMIFQLHM